MKYSFTRFSIVHQDATMQNGIRNVVSRMNGIENAVDAELEADGVGEPGALLDELEAGLAMSNRPQATSETTKVDDRGAERDPAGIVLRRPRLAAQHQDEQRADEREDDQPGEVPKPNISGLPRACTR